MMANAQKLIEEKKKALSMGRLNKLVEMAKLNTDRDAEDKKKRIEQLQVII